MRKIVPGMLILGGIIMAAALWKNPLGLYFWASPEKKFSMIWQNDLERLQKAKALHGGFQKLKTVKVVTPSEKLRRLAGQNPGNLKTNPQGEYELEIFMDEMTGGGVVIQYDLVNLKTGNTVWELGRTFTLPQLN